MTNKQAETENYKFRMSEIDKAALSVGKQIKTKAMFDAATGGGYCSKCDTVWCEPGTCNCIDYKNTRPNDDEINVYEREVWNAAIEAAAEKGFIFSIGAAEEIRKLKK